MHSLRLFIALLVLPFCVVLADDSPVTGTHMDCTFAASELGGLPTERDALVGTQAPGIGGILVGGVIDGEPSAKVDVFDPVSNKWSTLPDLPVARSRGAAAVMDGKLYVMGGVANDGYSKRVDILDLAKSEWSQGPDLPRGLADSRAFVFERRLLLIGGESGGNARKEVLELVEGKKGPDWEKIGTLKDARTRPGVCLWGAGGVLVAGGHDGKAALKTCELLFAAKGASVPDLPEAAAPALAARMGYPVPALMVYSADKCFVWADKGWMTRDDWPGTGGEPLVEVGGRVVVKNGKKLQSIAWSGSWTAAPPVLLNLEHHVDSATWLPSRSAYLLSNGANQFWLLSADMKLSDPIAMPFGVKLSVLSPDGKRILVAGDNATKGAVLDVATLEPVVTFKHEQDEVAALGFLADGKVFVAGQYDVVVFNQDGEKVASWVGHSSRLQNASTNAAGTRIATVESSAGLRVFSGATGEVLLRELRDPPDYKLCCVAFITDNRLLVGRSDGRVMLYDTETLRVIWVSRSAAVGRVDLLTLTPDRSLAFAMIGDDLAVLRTIDGVVIADIPSNGQNENYVLGFDPVGQRVIATGQSAEIESYQFEVPAKDDNK